MLKNCEGCKIRLALARVEPSYPYYSQVGGSICVAGNVNSKGFFGVTFTMNDTGLENRKAWYGESQKYNFNGCSGINSTDLEKR
jgi:hypothetical protein